MAKINKDEPRFREMGPGWKYRLSQHHHFNWARGKTAQIMLYANRHDENEIPIQWHIQAYFGANENPRLYGKTPKMIGSLDFDSFAEARTVAKQLIVSEKARSEFRRRHDAEMSEWARSQKPPSAGYIKSQVAWATAFLKKHAPERLK